MGQEELDKRIHELESRLAFQEHLIEELNDALSNQQLSLAELNNQVRVLMEQTRQILEESAGPAEIKDSKPPHY